MNDLLFLLEYGIFYMEERRLNMTSDSSKTRTYYEQVASEAEFEAWYQSHEAGHYKAPSVTADVALFTFNQQVQRVQLLITKRKANPERGLASLPGTFVRQGESLEAAAQREVAFETGLHLNQDQFKQVHVFSEPHRDPRGWTLSVAFTAFVKLDSAKSLNQKYNPQLVDLDEISKIHLAFDHQLVIRTVLDEMQTAINYNQLAFKMLGTQFALKDAKKIYEAFSKKDITTSNFKRVFVDNRALFQATGQKKVFGPGRPSELFKIVTD